VEATTQDIATNESLLEMWRDGLFIDVADALKEKSPEFVVSFCNYLVRFQGVNELSVLTKLLT
jgi:hypothetical protein